MKHMDAVLRHILRYHSISFLCAACSLFVGSHEANLAACLSLLQEEIQKPTHFLKHQTGPEPVLSSLPFSSSKRTFLLHWHEVSWLLVEVFLSSNGLRGVFFFFFLKQLPWKISLYCVLGVDTHLQTRQKQNESRSLTILHIRRCFTAEIWHCPSWGSGRHSFFRIFTKFSGNPQMQQTHQHCWPKL